MMGFLKKRHLYGFFLLLSLLYIYLLSAKAGYLKELLNREYLRHKEFLFMLNNIDAEVRSLDERAVREIIEGLGIEIKSISETPSGIEVTLPEVRASLLPRLIFKLEEIGKVVSLSSEDNTGKGKFNVRLVVKAK